MLSTRTQIGAIAAGGDLGDIMEEVVIGGRKHWRTIPRGAMKIREKNGLAVAYIVDNWHGTGKFLVKAFVGNAAKPAVYCTSRQRSYVEKTISNLFENLRNHKKHVDERRAGSNAGHELQAGQIITNSWGYDQTNVDWYLIVKTSKSFVWLQPISGAHTEATGPDSCRTVAHVDTSDPDPSKWEL